MLDKHYIQAQQTYVITVYPLVVRRSWFSLVETNSMEAVDISSHITVEVQSESMMASKRN